jgi:uncharacterized membrane protein YeaQ/YmgE (transglycosylase-associated protein family)
MDWIILLVVGAIIGWVASMIVRGGRSFGVFANIVVGIAGALLARWLFGTALNIDSANAAGSLSWAGIGWGIIGSVALLIVLQLISALFADDGYGSTTQLHS